MKVAVILIVVAILIGGFLVFGLASSKQGLASFPLFQGATQQQANVNPANATIFRSIDQGTTWFPQVAIDADHSIPPVTILDLELDRQDSNILYAGTNGDGLYKSTNNGQNWEKVYDQNRILQDKAVVYRMAQDTKNINRYYLAVFQNGYGVFLKTDDGGVSFVQTYIGQLPNYPVLSIAIDPIYSNIIYIGTAQGGFFMSQDFGETWQALQWLTGPVSDITINPANRSQIYAVVTGRGLFHSEDSGHAWQSFSTELSRISASNNVVMFRLDPVYQNTLYLALANGIVKSEDRGRTWKFVNILIPPKALPVDSVAVNPSDAENVYVGVGNEMYISTDGGINWSVKMLQTDKRISTIVMDPKDPTNIFLGMKVVKK